MTRRLFPLSARAPRRARLLVLVPLVAALGACTTSASGSSASGSSATGSASCDGVAGAHHAKLVVESAPGKVLVRCVGFSTPTLAATSMLTKSHVEEGTQQYSFGLAICQLNDVPAHYSQCLPSDADYWAVFVSHNGHAWTNPPTGVSDITLQPGDLLGFRYDSPKGNPAPPLPPSQV